MVGFIEFTLLTALAALFCNVCSLSIRLAPHLPQAELQYLKYGSTSVLYNKLRNSFGTLSLHMFNDANIFPHLLDLLSICMCQDSVSSIITPKYFTKLVRRIRLLSTLIAIKRQISVSSVMIPIT